MRPTRMRVLLFLRAERFNNSEGYYSEVTVSTLPLNPPTTDWNITFEWGCVGMAVFYRWTQTPAIYDLGDPDEKQFDRDGYLGHISRRHQ